MKETSGVGILSPKLFPCPSCPSKLPERGHYFLMCKSRLCNLSGCWRGLSIFMKSALKHETDWFNFPGLLILPKAGRMPVWAGGAVQRAGSRDRTLGRGGSRARTLGGRWGAGTTRAGALAPSATRRPHVAMAGGGPAAARCWPPYRGLDSLVVLNYRTSGRSVHLWRGTGCVQNVQQ